jgi:hypothetical protein
VPDIENDRWTWAGVSIFMLVATLCVAHGIVYKGVFKDVDVLAIVVTSYRRDVEDLLAKPLFRSTLREPSRKEEDRAESARKLRDSFEKLRIQRNLYAFSLDESGDEMALVARSWKNSLKPWSRVKGLSQDTDSSQLRPVDYGIAPELVAQINSKKAAISNSRDRMIQIEKGIQMIDIKLAELEKDAPEVSLAIVDAEISLCDARKASALADIALQSEKKILDFERAFYVASLVAPRIKTDLSPSGTVADASGPVH